MSPGAGLKLVIVLWKKKSKHYIIIIINVYTNFLCFTESLIKAIISKSGQVDTVAAPGSPVFLCLTFFSSLTKVSLRYFHLLVQDSSVHPSPT